MLGRLILVTSGLATVVPEVTLVDFFLVVVLVLEVIGNYNSSVWESSDLIIVC